MNKNEILDYIDFAVETTKTRIPPSYSDKEDYIYRALDLYLNQNFSNGFTRTNNARSMIESLRKEDIDKEILKNVVKIRFYSQIKGYPVCFNARKSYRDKLSMMEAEGLIINDLERLRLDDIKHMIDTSPNLYDSLIASFVDRRYFNESYGKENLDNLSKIPYDYQDLLDKIDAYYDNSRPLR